MNEAKTQEAKKHKHYDLIVQWVKDTNQKVWIYDKVSLGWIWVRLPVWDSAFDYKVQENKPTEPPVKRYRSSMVGLSLNLLLLGIGLNRSGDLILVLQPCIFKLKA